MRPRTLEEFVGQRHLLGEGKLLKRTILADRLTSLILYGPPGSGKTTLASIVSQVTGAKFQALNAVTANVQDLRKIIEEVRWELKIRGGGKVKIIVSGTLNEDSVKQLREFVDGFGVGTSVAYPPVIDFSAKIVEVYEDGKRQFRGKRGGLGGRKAVYRSKNFHDTVILDGETPPKGSVPMLKPLIRDGKIVRKFEKIDSIRQRVVKELRTVSKSQPKLSWM